VPEQDAVRISVGQKAKVALWAGLGVNVEGRIREIAGQADPASRTYAIRVALELPPQSLRLGMTALVTLTINDETAPMVVPLTALTEENGSQIAFVVDTARKAVRKTAVTVAGIAEGGARIASGLQPGDLIVTAGVQFLEDGMRIRLPGERSRNGAQ
jgi:multidrug efflux system membrane fusion protein